MLGGDDMSECEKPPCDHCPILNLSAGSHPQGKKKKRKKILCKAIDGHK